MKLRFEVTMYAKTDEVYLDLIQVELENEIADRIADLLVSKLLVPSITLNEISVKSNSYPTAKLPTHVDGY